MQTMILPTSYAFLSQQVSHYRPSQLKKTKHRYKKLIFSLLDKITMPMFFVITALDASRQGRNPAYVVSQSVFSCNDTISYLNCDINYGIHKALLIFTRYDLNRT